MPETHQCFWEENIPAGRSTPPDSSGPVFDLPDSEPVWGPREWPELLLVHPHMFIISGDLVLLENWGHCLTSWKQVDCPSPFEKKKREK